MKTLDDCSPEEALRFIQLYFATVDVLNEALEKYKRLATESTTTSSRSEYRALALEAERDLELLKNQRRAFLDGNKGIDPPSQATVDATKALAARLAKIIAKDAKADAIIAIARQGLEAFNKVTEA